MKGEGIRKMGRFKSKTLECIGGGGGGGGGVGMTEIQLLDD